MDSPYLDDIVMCQSGVSQQALNDRGSPHEYYNDCIDLAKTGFSLAGADKHGKILLRKTLSRGKLLSFIAQCPPCLIGMEACSGSHYWAREFEKFGHQVRIIAARFIEPYRKGARNDNNDADAICEAARRPNIWFVPVKSADP